MKILLMLAFLAPAISCCAQPEDEKRSRDQWEPLVYIDSLKLSYGQFQSLYFSPDKISNIDLVNNYYDSGSHVHGKIVIRTKNPKELKLLTLEDIERRYALSNAEPTLVMVDNDIVKDVSTVRVDSSYILRVEVLHADDLDYMKDSGQEVRVVKICTKALTYSNKEARFYIKEDVAGSE
ncbi:hypothetical protein QTN47_04845 [Danxiaibacter flavus]|uniref:Uncharacterized protein n=1 Tax=Danxiaibacter flavus TaxID=3049108 RepID=A0ABV3ZEH6_9BACT|nr:hypothetical protein QNM32_04845 [Chitinophagaceae bacterium DXS]